MRQLTAALAASALLLTGASAWGEGRGELLNVELAGGAGLSAYNVRTDGLLAPPFVSLEAAYLLVEIGPVIMGPSLALPLGFYDRPGDDGWGAQLALRPGWTVFGRPTVDLSWSVVAGPSLVVTPDFVWGLEVGGSVAYYLTAGLAVTAGLDYGFFYGVDPVHVFTGKLGLLLSWEVGT